MGPKGDPGLPTMGRMGSDTVFCHKRLRGARGWDPEALLLLVVVPHGWGDCGQSWQSCTSTIRCGR